MFDFGLRIKELREQRGWSQAMLGQKLGRSKSVVCSYENNVAVPPLEILSNMAVLFHVSLDYLVGIDKEEMLSLQGLTEEQKKLLYGMAEELKRPRRTGGGLSENQQQLLNQILVEFNRK